MFTGKARQAYNDLPQKYSYDYEKVKQTVLKIYELVPEAYRLKFRTGQINEDEGYVEFMRYKERLFNKWVTAKNVKTTHFTRGIETLCTPKSQNILR